jgi:predicted MFS family arabinose efflux permease
MSFSFILVATSSGPLGSVLAFAAAGLFCSALFPLLFVLAADELPARGPQVSGIFSAAVLAGLAVGAFGVGPLRAPLGLERIYLMSSIIPLLLAGVLLRLSVEPKRLPVSREG